jgi:hypothetical protein
MLNEAKDRQPLIEAELGRARLMREPNIAPETCELLRGELATKTWGKHG